MSGVSGSPEGSSDLIGLTSAAVCLIQHVESASGPSARERTLIGCSV